MTVSLTKDQFQRARTNEQRLLRRSQILQVARQTLIQQVNSQRRLSDLSFNDLAREVGLAKSNIMRYFSSREAIFLTLLLEEYADWVDEISAALPTHPEPDPLERAAAVLAQTALARPVLCELLTHLLTVLEHNVTTQEIIDFKLAVQREMARLTHSLQPFVGEWTTAQAGLFLGEMHACITHTWALGRPSEALQAAYAAEPGIVHVSGASQAVVQNTLATLLVGLKYRKNVVLL